MDKNFFDLVKDNFFRPLSGANREINYAILKKLNECMQSNMEYMSRADIVDEVVEYFKYRPGLDMQNDETGEKETDIKRYASSKVTYFEKSGWLASERNNDFTTAYQMTPAAIDILTAMANVEKNETKPIEYSGYVYSIYSQLKHFDLNQSTVIIEQMQEASKNLNNSLRSINNSIRKYLNDLLADETLTPNEIMKLLLYDYQNNVIARAFRNLRMTDNPSRYKNEIIELIDYYLYDNMGRMLENYIDVKCNGDKSGKNYSDAQEYITDVFNSIREQFENIEDAIKILDERNTKYVKTATSRVSFLMNDSVDFEGTINSVLKHISEVDLDDEDAFEFPLKEFGKIDENSLYSYTRRKSRVKSKISAAKVGLNTEELALERRKLLRQAQFSLKSIDEFICNSLKGHIELEAKDIRIGSDDDLIKLYLAQIYGGSEYVHYDVQLKDDFFEYGKFRLSNFTIYRR